MSVKEHYDKHLGDFYSWMVGDFDEKQKEYQQFLSANQITPQQNKQAIDLGAGHGIQSISLAKMGFKVLAIDFNVQLLNQLIENSKGLEIEIVEDDLAHFTKHISEQQELIVCAGDTLTHLNNKADIEKLLCNCCASLLNNGKLILSFRDYSKELVGNDRFIPVRSDANKILTCFLEYGKNYIQVTDILQTNENGIWKQKISSYLKVRVTLNDVLNYLELNEMKIILNNLERGMFTIIAEKISD